MKVDENLGETVEIVENWLRRFRMEGGVKKHLIYLKERSLDLFFGSNPDCGTSWLEHPVGWVFWSAIGLPLSAPKNSARLSAIVGRRNLRPVILKPVGRIFEIGDSNPIRRKCGKYGRPLSAYKKQGSEETPQSKYAENAENAENADAKTRKMRKMRLTGSNVTGFR